MAKKYLTGMRENAFKSLKDQGMLNVPIECVLHENVFPWVLDKMVEFLYEDDYIGINVEDIVRDAIEMSKD